MKHLMILAAVAMAAALGWKHLYQLSLDVEQSKINRNLPSTEDAIKTPKASSTHKN